mgnify:FL=1
MNTDQGATYKLIVNEILQWGQFIFSICSRDLQKNAEVRISIILP